MRHALYILVLAMTAPGASARAQQAPPAPPPPAVTGALDVAQAARLRAQGVGEIVFAARRTLAEHWYANFGYYACDSFRTYSGTPLLVDGARLYRLNLATGALAAILDDPKGGIRDPQVHYDGHRIVFSYRKGGTPNFHLYEINADGTGLRQLTDGPFDDLEPAYTADGSIVFVSSRCKRWVNCWLTHVATLHRCDADGANLRAISSNNEHDNTPWPLPDGRLLYMRWEYVDRSQVHYHHLWTANPDGTGQTVFYGNLNPGVAMLDAKPIAGTDKVVASFSPDHGREEHRGHIAIVDPKAGPDAKPSARVLTASSDFHDPWAFSEDLVMAALGPTVSLVNGRGEHAALFTLPETDRQAQWECHEPRPLTGRPREPAIPSRVDLKSATGRLMLDNVYAGRNMAGVKPGEIRKLLVLETLPMPIHFSGGMEPITYGGSFTLERILGTVPVEPDGSAHFEVPAMRSVFFVALDENDMAVKRMQSFATVQPGETLGCTGCHESRVTAPPLPGASRRAFSRPPDAIAPVADVPDVLDFPRDVQPILDRYCVPCHDADKRSGGVVLCGDRGPMYSHGYIMLTLRGQLGDNRNRPASNLPPRALGSSASPLMRKIQGAHHDVKATDLEKKTVRLWIESGAPYPGTYASLGSGMIGGYFMNNQDRQAEGWPAGKAGCDAIARRCDGCHNGNFVVSHRACDDVPDQRLNRHLSWNLSRPGMSTILRAPLAAAAGGLAICKSKGPDGRFTDQPANVFGSADDPDYALILAAVREAKTRLDADTRFDMADFKPRAEWIREMKRYGILPSDLPADAKIDVYATERKYWESLWFKPEGK